MRRARIRHVGPVLLVFGAAELGVRLLSPRIGLVAGEPPRAQEYFDARDIERGARFARPQLVLSLIMNATGLGVMTLTTLKARGRPAPGRPRDPARELAAGAARSVSLLVAATTASLPVMVIARRRAVAVGLDTQRWGGWAADIAKSEAIGSVLAAGGGAAIVGLTRRFPRGWWLAAAAGSVAFGGLFGVLVPLLLDPIFNKFTPLPDGPVRADVLQLAQAAGVDVGEVYKVDASRRTSGANAYVSGFGPTRRVVLFDTLVDRYAREEVRVVVAHELSHVRHRDVLRALAFSAIVAPAAAMAVQRLTYVLFGDPRRAEAIPALALSTQLVATPLGLIAGRLSRAVERRADAESLELTGAPEAFISLHRAIALQNVADVEPPWWARALLASHPQTLERIGSAAAYATRIQDPARSSPRTQAGS